MISGSGKWLAIYASGFLGENFSDVSENGVLVEFQVKNLRKQTKALKITISFLR